MVYEDLGTRILTRSSGLGVRSQIPKASFRLEESGRHVVVVVVFLEE